MAVEELPYSLNVLVGYHFAGNCTGSSSSAFPGSTAASADSAGTDSDSGKHSWADTLAADCPG